MQKLKSINLQIFWPIGIILLTGISIYVFNYQPGTWLSGWDNLHPEFDFGSNFKRSLFGVWQEYQGLGLLAGMGHSADLFRQIFLASLSLFLPDSFLRYFFHFLMLLLGPLGCFFLAKDVLWPKQNNFLKNWGGLTLAFFYLFNLATLQLFYVPYEAFSFHFGFLPWLFWANLFFLEKPSFRSFFWLIVINLGALGQGYVGTIALVYGISLVLVCLGWWWQKRTYGQRILLSLAIFFFINAFWLLPNLYFVLEGSEVNREAKINLMSTEENFLRNQKYGNLANVALLKGFWFDNVEAKGQDFQLMMAPWQTHLQNPFILAIGYSLFVLAILGFLLSLRLKENELLLFGPVLFLSLLMLANDVPPFSYLVKLLNHWPLFFQVFRFPFTKFSVLAAFCLAIFYGWTLIVGLKVLKRRVYQFILIFIFLSLPLIFLNPLFKGYLFYEKVRVVIPQEYFQVFDFFRKQPSEGRIANFPQANFWSWNFYRWPKSEYSGSGFLWYGIRQPILDRAFDPWSKTNENYYWEISYALYSKNATLFKKVLEKYQVRWVLIDENNVSAHWQASAWENLNEFLASSDFSLVVKFGKIRIYRFNQLSQNNFVFLAQNLTAIGPIFEENNYDRAYFEIGNYFSVSDPFFSPSFYYPFRSLFTGRLSSDVDFEIEEKENFFIFRKRLPERVANYQLKIPPFTNQELVWVNPSNLNEIRFLIPQVYRENKNLVAVIPKVNGYFSAQIEPAVNWSLKTNNCAALKQGKVEKEIIANDGENVLRLMAWDANNCSAAFPLENLSHKYSYLIAIKNRHLQGRRLLFWLENLTSKRADLELFLEQKSNWEYLIQPPMAKDGLGYALHFDNISIGRQKTVNDLIKVIINPLPFDFLTGLTLVSTENQEKAAELKPVAAVHPNPSLYEVQLDNVPKNSTLVLSQSFHQGWKAYFIDNSKFKMQNAKLMNFLAPILGKEIKDHVIVNNWENGWDLKNIKFQNSNSKIYLIFLPQYLQYLGYGLGLIPWLFLIKSKF